MRASTSKVRKLDGEERKEGRKESRRQLCNKFEFPQRRRHTYACPASDEGGEKETKSKTKTKRKK